ncbi:hypothetical protein H8B09_09950 [Paenibacillus sp. PR3]|uniref:DUF4878 domain-containing protein n=1 Tax=Paenibacillus terricola TaxID=2763503 RepID=A0ABR8MSX4_9BACL|nr:hypothetical protein [Paenibacillus terricola]MBD3919077.1 hypothetical protein [Paenibacillus terricola]
MKNILVISSLIVLTLLAACSSVTDKQATSDDGKSVTTSSSTTTNKQPTTKAHAELLDERAYQGDELAAIKVINQRVSAFNERNVDNYAAAYTSDAASGIDQNIFQEMKTTITKLTTPKFIVVTKDGISVFVHESYQDSSFGPEGDTLYTLMKVDGKWKISGTD